MSQRLMRRTISGTCADCSAPEANWASVNRGVIICDECCSVHRALGRHISDVKSINKSQWVSSRINLIQQLVNVGANNIWEHLLIEPSKTKQRKPTPRDPLHSLKTEFIRAKYLFLAFTNKPGVDDNGEELNRQLHSSVRTANVDTSLRLIAYGADPNYFHPEKGSCPLHVAAHMGQFLQAELLLVYGADPGALDAMAKTPVDLARTAKHFELAERLVENHYELTDRLSFFICNRRPDHKAGQHYLIPEVADSCSDVSELAKVARQKLEALPNVLFEELAMDVYDEVDRRENNQLWMSGQSDASDKHLVPFLPVNPEYSSTRNQGRQKLARFNSREFATLVIDILHDARRRSNAFPSPVVEKYIHKNGANNVMKKKASGNGNVSSDEDPVYDDVPSDEDYALVDDCKTRQTKEDCSKSMCSNNVDGAVLMEEFMDVKNALSDSQSKITHLVQTNNDLKQEMTLLNSMPNSSSDDQLQVTKLISGDGSSIRCSTEIETSPWYRQEGSGSSFGSSDDRQRPVPKPRKHRNAGESSGSDYENTPVESKYSSQSSVDAKYCSYGSADGKPSNCSTEEKMSCRGSVEGQATQSALPSQEEIVRKTEQITKKIQKLLLVAKDGHYENLGDCAMQVYCAVTDMTSRFPVTIADERIEHALSQLLEHGEILSIKCNRPEHLAQDPRALIQQAIGVAYNVAKAAKNLVVLFD